MQMSPSVARWRIRALELSKTADHALGEANENKVLILKSPGRGKFSSPYPAPRKIDSEITISLFSFGFDGVNLLANRFDAYLRDFTSSVGRNRSADQTSSMAIWETGRQPVPSIAAQTASRLRSLSTPEVFFG